MALKSIGVIKSIKVIFPNSRSDEYIHIRPCCWEVTPSPVLSCPALSCCYIQHWKNNEKPWALIQHYIWDREWKSALYIKSIIFSPNLLRIPLKSCCCEVTPSPSTEWLLRSYHGLEVVFLWISCYTIHWLGAKWSPDTKYRIFHKISRMKIMSYK